jgi:hypothetical protein
LKKLGVARRGKGRIAFAPAAGRAGRRRIVAHLEVEGIPAPEQIVARYKAPPPPRAGRVKRVRVRRRGKTLLVSWTRASHTVQYGVVVRQRNGRQKTTYVGGRRHRARIRRIPLRQSGTVKVSALGPLRDRGRPGTGRFKATRRPVDRRLPFSELGRGEPRPLPRRLAPYF